MQLVSQDASAHPPPHYHSVPNVHTHGHTVYSISHQVLFAAMYTDTLTLTAAVLVFSSSFVLIELLYQHPLSMLLHPSRPFFFYHTDIFLFSCFSFHSELPMSSPLQGSQPLCLWSPQQQALPPPSKLCLCLDPHMFHHP